MLGNFDQFTTHLPNISAFQPEWNNDQVGAVPEEEVLLSHLPPWKPARSCLAMPEYRVARKNGTKN